MEEYPEGVDEPVITAGEAGAGSPIAWTLLQSQTPGFDVQALGDQAEDRIKPFLERVEGVSEVRVYGGRRREVHIGFDPEKVAQRGLTFAEIDQALRAENVSISAGELAEGQYDTRVRVVGEYTTLEQIRDTVLKDDAGGPIRIRDVAEVELGLEKRRGFVRSRGSIAMALPVYRESGANVMQVMESLKERLERVNTEVLPALARQYANDHGLAEPPHLELRQVYDETTYIEDALALVRDNLVVGGVLAAIVLLVFLRSLRPTAVVALAIPISVVGTFVVMWAMGRNINVISLAGLAFAVGMVVDNAIVVLENIDRHLAMGKSPRQAALDGTREVWGAILASTLTTLVVFAPVVVMQEEAGQLFRDITIAICAAVTLSLLVSITVIPSASARFLKPRRAEGRVTQWVRSLGGFATVCGHGVSWFARTIEAMTQRSAAGVVLRVTVVVLAASGSLLGAAALMPPTDYLPAGNKNLVFGFIVKPPGFTIEKGETDAKATETVLSPLWEATTQAEVNAMEPILHPFTQQPLANLPGIENYFHVTFRGNTFHGATSANKENVAPLSDALSSAAMKSIPGTFAIAFQSSIFGRGSSTSRTIEVEVSGADLTQVQESAGALLWALRGKYGFGSVRPSPLNFDLPSREVTVTIDRVKAAEVGVNVASLGGAIEALVDGAYVGDYRLGGETIDIIAQRSGTDVLMPEDLAQLPLAYQSDSGERGTVPQLKDIAVVERTLAPQEIRRLEEQRAVRLEVTPPENVPLETATQDISGLIASMRGEGGPIPDTIQTALEGSASKLDQVQTALLGKWTGFNIDSLQSVLSGRLFLALLVVYLLMAALFESFLYPLVILVSVPLAAVGGFIGLCLPMPITRPSSLTR